MNSSFPPARKRKIISSKINISAVRIFPKMLLLISFIFLMNGRCAIEKGTMDTGDAWNEIYIAIDRKAKECGNRPPYFLPVFDNPNEYGVRLCSLSIIRQACPFNNYPVFCVEMLGIDLPYIGP